MAGPLLILLLALAATGCSLSIDLYPRVRPLEEETVEGQGAAKVLLIDVSGFLSEAAPPSAVPLGAVPRLVRFREELKKAADDAEVKALVLRINSAGGTVTASDVMYRELELFRREKNVPVVAVMMDVGASGAYYLALAADTIIVHPTTVTGSIGVVMINLNAQGLLEKIGVSADAIKSGEQKDMGSPFRSLTAEERTIFQSVIDGLHQRFVNRVVERRRLPAATARTLADGRIFTADQAAALGLVDRIGYVADAIDLAQGAAGLDEARVVVYHRPRQYRATYYARAEATETGLPVPFAELGAILGPGPRFLYAWVP